MKRIAGLLAVAGMCASSACIAQSMNDARPNILYIVADDLGFTDIGAFGGEIPTPHLDRLAYQGVRLANLHAAPTCQPSRVMMMTSGDISDALEVRPPQNGMRHNLLSLDWATLPELLQDAGYQTYMTGKWDLGYEQGYAPDSRGFDRSFVQLGSSASHFAEKLWGEESLYELDGERIAYDALPDDFYTTNHYTDRMIEFIEGGDDSAPWFAYVPYTTPHYPLQVPDDALDRFAGHYDAGYDALRQQRAQRASALGVVPQGAGMADFDSLATPWAELSPDQQRKYARSQEIYAAMVENLDINVGRIIAHLDETGELDNTVVLFMSDHGASSAEHGHVVPKPGQPGVRPPDFIDNRFENWGRPNSFIDHGKGFAEAASAPFRGHKGVLNEGGLRAAGFVYYPPQVKGGAVDHSALSFLDILPTVLDIAGTQHPGAGAYAGRTINAIEGHSFWPHITGDSSAEAAPMRTVGWKLGKRGALIRGTMKIINTDRGGRGIADWQLYDLAADPGERHDLASEHPDLAADLVAEWEADWR